MKIEATTDPPSPKKGSPERNPGAQGQQLRHRLLLRLLRQQEAGLHQDGVGAARGRDHRLLLLRDRL